MAPTWSRIYPDWFFHLDRATVSGEALAFGAMWLVMANTWGRRADGSAVICDQSGRALDSKRLASISRLSPRKTNGLLKELQGASILGAPVLVFKDKAWVFPSMQVLQEGPDAARARRRRATRDVDKDLTHRTRPAKNAQNHRTRPVKNRPKPPDASGDTCPPLPRTPSPLQRKKADLRRKNRKNDGDLDVTRAPEEWDPPVFRSVLGHLFKPSKRDLKTWQKTWPFLNIEQLVEAAWHSQERRLKGQGETPPWKYPRVGIESMLERAHQERAQRAAIKSAVKGGRDRRTPSKQAHKEFESISPEEIARQKEEAQAALRKYLPAVKAQLGIKE